MIYFSTIFYPPSLLILIQSLGLELVASTVLVTRLGISLSVRAPIDYELGLAWRAPIKIPGNPTHP